MTTLPNMNQVDELCKKFESKALEIRKELQLMIRGEYTEAGWYDLKCVTGKVWWGATEESEPENLQIQVPKPLQNDKFRFILLGKGNEFRTPKTKDVKYMIPNDKKELNKWSDDGWKAQGKIPQEADWQNKKNYSYNNPRLLKHLLEGKNYGVATGFNHLAVMDDDSDDLKLSKLFDKEFGESFRVKTGSGGYHNYIIVTDVDKTEEKQKKLIFFDSHGKHMGELQFQGQQVVGPGSIHPLGKEYEVDRDLPILTIDIKDIKKAFKSYLTKRSKVVKQHTKTDWKGANITDIPLGQVISFVGLQDMGNNCYQGPHPLHGSSGGMNFRIDTANNTWFCFRCNSGGGPSELIGVMERIINCNEAGSNCYSTSQAQQVINVARKKYGLEEPVDIISELKGKIVKATVEKDGSISKRKVPSKRNNEKVNFIEDAFYDTWEKVKGRVQNTMKPDDDLFFAAHKKDKITGKAQPLSEVMNFVPLVQKVEVKDKKTEEITFAYKFLDEKVDSRYNRIVDSLVIPFWTYRLVDKGVEYIVLSEKKLGLSLTTLRGMEIKMSQTTELSKSFKLRTLANIFIVGDIESSIRTLNPTELINLTKDMKEKLGLDKEMFKNYLYLHPDGNIYNHDPDYALIQIAQLLSSKYEGYPLHLLHIGPPGFGKTCYLECLNQKFQEDSGILESGNGTIKALIPSFKENPASPGYVLKCFRYGLVDELMKMIENVGLHAGIGQLQKQYLGQLNVLLEHKKRTIGSGNNNSFMMQATAKMLVATNPLKGKDNVTAHLSVIDESTLSRFLIVVQDENEQEFIKTNRPKTFENVFLNPKKQNGHLTSLIPNKVNVEYITNDTMEQPSSDSWSPSSTSFGTKVDKTVKSLITSANNDEKIRHLTKPRLIPNGEEERVIGHKASLTTLCFINNEYSIKVCHVTKKATQELISLNPFLTIFDSCQCFLIKPNHDRIESIFVKALAHIPAELQRIWIARGRHHLVLLFDGIAKFRCLFQDYDATFEPKDVDYLDLEKLTVRIVKGWSTNLAVKRDWRETLKEQKEYTIQ